MTTDAARVAFLLRETTGENVRNALEILRGTDPRTLGIDELGERLAAVDARLTAAAGRLRALGEKLAGRPVVLPLYQAVALVKAEL